MSIAESTSDPFTSWPEWRRAPRECGSQALRTTLPLNRDLLAAIDREILAGRARSRSEFINAAILGELRSRERAAIDASIRLMASDPAYRAEMRQIDAEFAAADAESWAAIDAEHGPYEE